MYGSMCLHVCHVSVSTQRISMSVCVYVRECMHVYVSVHVSLCVCDEASVKFR